MGKHLAFTVSICGKGKASELRRMMSYKRDMFIFEWGVSPYRQVPSSLSITVRFV